MISIEMMVVMWTTKLEVSSDLKHLGSLEVLGLCYMLCMEFDPELD